MAMNGGPAVIVEMIRYGSISGLVVRLRAWDVGI